MFWLCVLIPGWPTNITNSLSEVISRPWEAVRPAMVGPNCRPIMNRACLDAFPHFLSKEKDNLQLEKVRKSKTPKNGFIMHKRACYLQNFSGEHAPDTPSMALPKWQVQVNFTSDGPADETLNRGPV